MGSASHTDAPQTGDPNRFEIIENIKNGAIHSNLNIICTKGLEFQIKTKFINLAAVECAPVKAVRAVAAVADVVRELPVVDLLLL